jgi:hypothetical protein
MVLPRQEDGFSCVPRCVKMIFMYIGNSFEGRAPDFDLERIGKIIETKGDGTFPEKVLNLNSNKISEVASAIPSIEFELKLSPHSLDEIESEIVDKQPPIAWIRLYDEEHIKKCAHAVVITGIEREKGLVYYNDPIFGEKTARITDFVTLWDEEDRILIKVKIGKKKQRMLEEFDQQKPIA